MTSNSLRAGTRPIEQLIVGAGPHGMAVAVHMRHLGVRQAELYILDPEPEPLACWRRRAVAVGMSSLRSPAWLHIDLDRMSLINYAVAIRKPLDNENQCPPLDLFNGHACYVLARAGIDDIGLTGIAQDLARTPQGWRVDTNRGSVLARMVVLALGSADGGHWPAWARSLEHRGVSIEHVLETRSSHWQSGSLAVVGAGLSAAQVALAAAGRGQCVTMFARRPLRIAHFDTHPRWFSDDALVAYRSIQPPENRQGELMRGRNPGTVTPAVAHRLMTCLGAGPGRVKLVADPIGSVAPWRSGARFTWATGVTEADHVLLATGFEQRMPSARWITRVARTLGLPLAASGHPVPDAWLQWAPGLYVCGALAELQLGPTARGLAGGRRAAQLIAHHICGR